MSVCVLDRDGEALMPCNQKRARKRLACGLVHAGGCVQIDAATSESRCVSDGLSPWKLVQGMIHQRCPMLQRADGFVYLQQLKIAFPRKEARQGRHASAELSLPVLNERVSRAIG